MYIIRALRTEVTYFNVTVCEIACEVFPEAVVAATTATVVVLKTL